nr:immunoglobulin heavy chain junction region [Macaca mulatta]MPO14402.1 immunoglobulin heavy chain junction region [Macaca mulatta]MPO14418.1 immunoglobulin heavy chain junction region [Macaca mulatta]MPO14434.1 immunoglobulin heavy chain junction region [Macaca mulatta]MPO14445.1 immunoglobulin heavy chain junction region [Macaca mulatta]
CVRDGLRIFW